jgi:uncharacterized phiE125 gp8 family phage protein
MTLVLTTPPATAAVSLADAKTHLRISHADDDAYVTKLISAAEKLIEQRCGLRLIQQSWALFLDCWPPDGTVLLHMSPVQQLDEIILYSEDDTPAMLDLAHVYLDKHAKPARVVLRHERPRPQAGRRTNGIEFRFQAGFAATTDGVPQDIQQAILITIAHWFDHRGEGEGGALPIAAAEILQHHFTVRLT